MYLHCTQHVCLLLLCTPSFKKPCSVGNLSDPVQMRPSEQVSLAKSLQQDLLITTGGAIGVCEVRELQEGGR